MILIDDKLIKEACRLKKEGFDGKLTCKLGRREMWELKECISDRLYDIKFDEYVKNGLMWAGVNIVQIDVRSLFEMKGEKLSEEEREENNYRNNVQLKIRLRDPSFKKTFIKALSKEDLLYFKSTGIID